MTTAIGPGRISLTQALEAVGKLWEESFAKLESSAVMAALSVYGENQQRPVSHNISFYRHFFCFRDGIVALLANHYRMYFKLALAHPRQAGRDPGQWSWNQLQPAVYASLEWIRNWYILSCDGETQFIRRIRSSEFVPGQTGSLSIASPAAFFPPPEPWCAPAWLFQVSLPLFGIGLMKQKNMPDANSEQKLSKAHTRLLLKGARRVFLSHLRAKIETVRNDEIAAAGAMPAGTANGRTRGPNKRKGSEQKLKLYGAIQDVLNRNSSLQGIDFCAELDKRHAPPLFDWTKRGEWQKGLTWKEAWGNQGLRRKIRRVRQEAMKTF